MKKIICFALCLMILSMAVMTAGAEKITKKTRSTFTVQITTYRTYATACKTNIPGKAGYNRTYARLNLKAVFERGPGLSNEGTEYSVSDHDEATVNGSGGIKLLITVAQKRNSADGFIKNKSKAEGIIEYSYVVKEN
ncbi:MAG: hypothetical protein IKS46_03925 [Clostridia bacterium]|nr:hypothetical protein [Clostridia bacterium]